MAKISQQWQNNSPFLFEKLLGLHFNMIMGRLCHGSVTEQVRELILMGCSTIK
jgi:hypothetical protein